MILFEHKLPDGVELVEMLVGEESFTDGEVLAFFTPEGGAATHSVVLYHRQTDSNYTIEVIGLTGLIRFHDGRVLRDLPREGELD
jgi:hypothetical protein